MSCEQPLRIKNPRYRDRVKSEVKEFSQKVFNKDYPPDFYIDVPCGWCKSCQSARLASFRFRLQHEFTLFPDSTFFLTLTFDEQNLERFKDNPNKAILLFLDRFRKRDKHIKHFFCAEYGERKGRLHYHGLIFGCDDRIMTSLKDLWKYGFSDIQKCDIHAIDYVTKYMTKGTDANRPSHRVIVSKGIGLSFLDKYKRNDFIKDGEVNPIFKVDGITYPLPRYYRDKLFTDDDKHQLLYKQYCEPFKGYVKGVVFDDYQYYRDYLRSLNSENIRLGFTPKVKPPTKQRKHKQSILQNYVETTNSF